ncbi:hypothetical protein ACOSZF_16690 [Cytobacillus firmus]|uniref:Uncharacterized protein n=1 Tax=Cytobacillus firmus TaxID=1399 RepID=A0A380XSU4_CYTFI|nr:hypothetical protein [Cytobacillus firmus]KAF0823127.1 hypothetical protein KIS1582_3108 [Cytobacillus firmus]MDD9311690.1 hypothetical protein [Cytobacillus firmus]MEC1894475.1 hypothetical protein [Cytobacillus firmus]MED1908446.1 hypothetical protein [Cytobacillus firmus]MED1942286.1 hypothetical protein [Cytobacillus firmus]
MFILSGIFYLVLLCSSILALSSIPISLYPKKKATKNTYVKDYYSSLFDVYGDEA